MNEKQLRLNPRPWLTSGSIDFIEKKINCEDTVLEFGGGWSSIWWAKKCKFTLTVEANHEWAAKIILEFANHPAALAKWSLKFVPSDWNPTASFPKRYWKNNFHHLTEETISSMTERYLSIDFNPSIIVIDGSIRHLNIEKVDEYLKSNSTVRMLVIDNTEVLLPYTLEKFENFERHDFHESDLSLIPSHQNGKWCTSVWLKK